MKKYISVTLFVLLLLGSASFNATAGSNNYYSWYCKRNKEHLQPEIDAEMKFIETHQCYYVDKKVNDSGNKIVYLTFDAGYENGNVEKILDILKEENVKGSFFILENLLARHPDLVCRMQDEGHVVGNHTAHHKDISMLSFSELKKELETVETLFKEKTGRELPKYFRPPEGRFSLESITNIEKLNYKTVFWSLAYADWDNNNQPLPQKAIEKIMSNIHNGAIILLHPTSETNVKILPHIIKELKEQGYEFKTVENL